jgi:hypothetical protein
MRHQSSASTASVGPQKALHVRFSALLFCRPRGRTGKRSAPERENIEGSHHRSNECQQARIFLHAQPVRACPGGRPQVTGCKRHDGKRCFSDTFCRARSRVCKHERSLQPCAGRETPLIFPCVKPEQLTSTLCYAIATRCPTFSSLVRDKFDASAAKMTMSSVCLTSSDRWRLRHLPSQACLHQGISRDDAVGTRKPSNDESS